MAALQGKKVAIVGLGESGAAAARLCHAQHARVTCFDEAPLDRLAHARELEKLGVTLCSQKFVAGMLAGFDLVIASPGVPRNDAVAAAEGAGIPVLSELEVASWFLTAPIALIGGTNGKSTTTAMVAAILQGAGKRVFAGGNFGTPLAAAVGGDYDALVVEISSFQAERVPSLHAHAHALLNLSADHLDRYPDFAHYAEAKGNPFVQMTPADVAVIPYGDPLCAKQAARGRARVVTFSASDQAATVVPDSVPVGGGLTTPDLGAIVDSGSGHRVPLSALRLAGRHNVANACAALAVAGSFGLPPSDGDDGWLARAVAGFSGLGHRCVLCGEIDHVRYYDDSKGTNVGASVAALAGLNEPLVVLIAGGRDKLGGYEPLVCALRAKGRALVVLGEAAERIAAAARGVLPIERARSMDEAVGLATELARPGDAVLLSPACSSFDMFANYQERGDAFQRAVKRLAGGSP